MTRVQRQAKAMLEEMERAERTYDAMLGIVSSLAPHGALMVAGGKLIRHLAGPSEYERELRAAAAGKRSTLPEPPVDDAPWGLAGCA